MKPIYGELVATHVPMRRRRMRTSGATTLVVAKLRPGKLSRRGYNFPVSLMNLCLFLSFLALSVHAADSAVSVTIREQWSNLFAGKESAFHAIITSRGQFNGRVGWRLASSGRTIARSENTVALKPGSTETVELHMQIPEIKDGVVMQVVLTVTLYETGAEKETASVERSLWLFPDNAFSEKTEWLKKLGIHLFDPMKKTAAVFTDSKIPFTEEHNIDALSEIKDGMLIIGEGISFKDYRGLSEMLYKVSSSGIPVLCLAPDAGEMAIPGMGSAELPQPASVSLNRSDIIRQLDKRLDADAWPPDGKVTISSIKLQGERGGSVVGQVIKGAEGWPWLEVSFGNEKGLPVRPFDLTQDRQAQGRLVICGFGIVEKWQASPTPRFLLARLLEYVAASKP